MAHLFIDRSLKDVNLSSEVMLNNLIKLVKTGLKKAEKLLHSKVEVRLIEPPDETTLYLGMEIKGNSLKRVEALRTKLGLEGVHQVVDWAIPALEWAVDNVSSGRDIGSIGQDGKFTIAHVRILDKLKPVVPTKTKEIPNIHLVYSKKEDEIAPE